MDIRERIKNVIVNSLVEAKLTEKFDIGADDSDKMAAIKAKANERAVKKAQGPNTAANTFDRPSKEDQPSNPKKKPMPLKPKGSGKKSEGPVQAVRGKTINTSRGSGNEGAKAAANEKAFNKMVSKQS